MGIQKSKIGTSGSQTSYTGQDNLEVMEEAVNYNEYLLNAVFRFASAATRVIDYGAGRGIFSESLSLRGINVECVEPDEELHNLISSKGIAVYPSLASVDDQSVDFLYSLNVLEHIKDDKDALREIVTKLIPNGKVFIYVPAFKILYSSMDRKVGHFRRYTRRGLEDKMLAVGFEILESRYVDSLGFFASLAYKMFGGDSGGINRAALKIYDKFVFPLSRLTDFVFRRFCGKNLLIVAYRKL